MSDKKTDKNTDDATAADVREMARKIWLAGLGAYGRAFSEGRDMLKTAQERGSDVFEDLVARGETLEDDVDDKARSMMDEVRSQVSDLNLDERISRMRDRIKREGKSAASKAGRDLETRVGQLEARLKDILDAIEGKPDEEAQAKTARKATTKKTTTKRTPAKKSASRKKAPAKTTTTKSAPKSGSAKANPKKPASSKPKK